MMGFSSVSVIGLYPVYYRLQFTAKLVLLLDSSEAAYGVPCYSKDLLFGQRYISQTAVLTGPAPVLLRVGAAPIPAYIHHVGPLMYGF